MNKDLLQSIRSLIRHPALTAVAVITLTLAIGVNTMIFSVVNAVLLKALPFRNPEQLVSVNTAWKDHNTSFDDLAAFTDNNFNLTGNGEPERLSCVQVTSSLFTTHGVQPVRGRFFLARTLARQREMAVRAAVGARRWQLIRQLLTESVLVGLVGGALGLLIAVWRTRAVATLVPAGLTTDSVTFFVVSSVFFVIAMAAALIPAMRRRGLIPLWR